MHVGWIGGVEGSESSLVRVAEQAGHSLEMHAGHTRDLHRLDGLVSRADVIVIVLDTNSHGAVIEAQKLARKHGRRAVLVRRQSVSALKKVLSDRHVH